MVDLKNGGINNMKTNKLWKELTNKINDESPDFNKGAYAILCHIMNKDIRLDSLYAFKELLRKI